jgi:hypothetical protein
MDFEKKLNEAFGSGGTPSSDEIAERIVDACGWWLVYGNCSIFERWPIIRT